MKGTPLQPQCGFSQMSIHILQALKIPLDKVSTFNVLADPNIREGIKKYSGWPTIPQLYVNGEFVGGCDIMKEEFEAGNLKEIVLKGFV